MRTLTIVLALFMGILATARSARAEQYQTAGKVVHTRMAPVVVHRIFPPYRGVHVYQGRSVRR